MKLGQIRIVLVQTTHPGNIGGVARAMKNMGLSRLALVQPKIFPSEEADARSSGATEILQNAEIFDSLQDAVSESSLVIGTSARSRHIPWPLVSPREMSSVIAAVNESAEVSIVFGREDRGLTNEELHLCHLHVHIPTDPSFSSLNIAAAVQVIAYELRMKLLSNEAVEESRWGVQWDVELAEHQELERMFDHLERALVKIDFLDPENPRQLMPRLRRLFLRAVPDKLEVNVLRGILTAVERQSGRD